MSRREQIRMSAAEVDSFLAGERTVTCATIGPRGWPHLMPLWYVLREASDGGPGPRIWAWTYAASQKVRNLECEVIVHRDLQTVGSVGVAILLRNSVARGVEPPPQLPGQAHEAVSAQAAKRVALEFSEHRRASW